MIFAPEVEVLETGPFGLLYNLPEDINVVVCIGGRGGRKTYEISKFTAYYSTIKEKRCVVLRDEKELIRESILNEILTRFDTADEDGLLSANYERLETGIKKRGTKDAMVVFTKGFRASNNLKNANLKGISDIDLAIVEEAEDIRDVNKFNTFADSIRKHGSVIIIILNTPDINHWIVKRYFTAHQITFKDVPELKRKVDEKELIGYFRIEPKNIRGFKCIQTSYKDNYFLPEHITRNYENYGNPDSETYNLHYYLTAIKGFASTGRKGQVIKKAKPIKLKDYLALPYKEYYGQDFGISSPAGTIGLKKHKNNIWVRELNYKPMHAKDIGKMYCTLGLTDKDKIVADFADSQAINRLSDGFPVDELTSDEIKNFPRLRKGFFVVPCSKPKDSITYGIDIIDRSNFYVVEESKNYWNEIYNYIYAQDKNGNYTNDPVDDFNHLIDPTRYVLVDLENPYDDWTMTREN